MTVNTKPFGAKAFFLRWAFAFFLVCVSFNATGYSLLHWLKSIFPAITPAFAVCFVLVLIGWGIYIRATVRSLGSIGVVLLSLLLVALIWLIWDMGWLSIGNFNALSWLGNISVSLVLAVGISWSHIRRKITGQQDVDDVQD